MKRIFIIALFFSLFCNVAIASYEVKGKGISSSMYSDGKCETNKSRDEATYIVDLDSKTITRTSVLNADIKDGPFAGLQSDNTVYHIVYNDISSVCMTEANKGKRIIKAIGQAGLGDGFETIVIGEDFIDTCNSKFDYFMLYHYKIVK